MPDCHPVRVRFAPSPTGSLHIGGARTAIYNWAFARHYGGTFVLRIEDTDPERSTAESTEQIIRSLAWLGLAWDEGPQAGGDSGPYFQTERQALYERELAVLKAAGSAYPCFCTPEELARKREQATASQGATGYDRHCRSLSEAEAQRRIDAGEPHTWRLKVPTQREEVSFDDLVYGTVRVPIGQLDDFILVRSDGKPTYNFAACVDDALMGITHVIRGDDHLSNTPKQILVYEALGREVPAFAHLSMILGADGSRLSKRHGATSVEAFRDAGYLPEALVNYLSLLGWSLDGATTVIDKATLCESFSLDRVSRNPAVFDEAKLDWMNQVYLKEMGAARFVDAIVPYLEKAGFATAADVAARRNWFEGVYPLVAERVHTLAEVCPLIAYLFAGDTLVLDDKSVEKCLAPAGTRELLERCASTLEGLAPAWGHAAMDTALRALAAELEVKVKAVFQAVRVATCGNMVSPPLLESLELLGRDETLRRIRTALPHAGL
ncbi:MAG: glutamate--tRNA ligase [Coriobacteriales bacterium]|jgi:glutamyl-tRNA synthetase|nr:glutamate--tRNA ligase [Coriobacteriales bacterium]